MTQAKPRSLLWPTVMTAVGIVILLGLGTWQLERKAWKEGLIQRIEDRSKAAPIPLDEAARRFSAGEDMEYARIQANGRLVGRPLLFWHPRGAEPGFHVYAPLETSGGKIVMLNRGFVPEPLASKVLSPSPDAGASRTIVGLLRGPGHKARFDPDNNVHANRWYWRDLPAMLKAALPIGSRDAYPFFVDEQAPAQPRAGAPEYPAPAAGLATLPNRHLEYALTWYGLAVTLIGVYIAFLIPRRRSRA